MNLIAAGAEAQGTLNAQESVQIDGRFQGEARSRLEIAIGGTGDASGDMTAPMVNVQGRVEGKIHATRQLEIGGGARFKAELSVQPEMLVISSRVQFDEGSE